MAGRVLLGAPDTLSPPDRMCQCFGQLDEGPHDVTILGGANCGLKSREGRFEQVSIATAVGCGSERFEKSASCADDLNRVRQRNVAH